MWCDDERTRAGSYYGLCNIWKLAWCGVQYWCGVTTSVHVQGRFQYCTPVGSAIYIPIVKPHVKGNIWEFCVVNLTDKG